jgi:hypothetical protein
LEIKVLLPQSRLHRRTKWAIAAALTVAFFAYAIAWPTAPVATNDSPSYLRVANDIRHLRLTELHERTPGYPLLLVLTGSVQQPTRSSFYASLALQLLTVACFGYLLAGVGVSTIWVWLFILIALLPPFVEPAAYVMTESLSGFGLGLTYAFLLAWLRSGRKSIYLAFSVMALYTALIRPTYQALPVFLLFCLPVFAMVGIIPKNWLKLLAPLGATAVLCLSVFAIWALVNYARFGFFGTNSLGPYALSTKTATFVESLPEQYAGIRSILVKYRDRYIIEPFNDHTAQNYIFRAFPEVRAYYQGDEVKALRAIEEVNTYLILHKPFSYLGDCLRVLGTYWTPNDAPLSAGQSTILRALWAVVQLMVVGVFFVQLLAVFGLILFFAPLGATKRSLPSWMNVGPDLMAAYVIGIALIVYTMVVSCFLGIGAARYRVPTDLMILSTTIMGFAIWSRITASVSTSTPSFLVQKA